MQFDLVSYFVEFGVVSTHDGWTELTPTRLV